MDWTNNGALELIEQYRLHTELWNRSDPKYKDKVCRFHAWSKIAERFNCTKAEVERKMNVLLTQYRREKHKMLIKYYEGIQPGQSKWYAFKYFAFLETSPNSSIGLNKSKRRDLKLFGGMRHFPMLLNSSHQANNNWASGPFSPSSNSKHTSMLSFLLPLANAASSNASNQSVKNYNNHITTEQQLLSNSNKNTDNMENKEFTAASPDGTSKPFNLNSDHHRLHTIDLDNENAIHYDNEMDIKPDIENFLHQPLPLHQTESNPSLSSPANDDDQQSDDFAQDLRITSSRNVDFNHYGLPTERGQSNESTDSKISTQIEFNKRLARLLLQERNERIVADSDKDDCDYIGSIVTSKLRSMDRNQRIIAEKLISDVLFFGQFGELEQSANVKAK